MIKSAYDQAISFPDFGLVATYIKLKYELSGLLAPDTLYHYTDINAFKNILETRCLWASNVYF